MTLLPERLDRQISVAEVLFHGETWVEGRLLALRCKDETTPHLL